QTAPPGSPSRTPSARSSGGSLGSAASRRSPCRAGGSRADCARTRHRRRPRLPGPTKGRSGEHQDDGLAGRLPPRPPRGRARSPGRAPRPPLVGALRADAIRAPPPDPRYAVRQRRGAARAGPGTPRDRHRGGRAGRRRLRWRRRDDGVDERWLFYWTDRAERAYVALRFRGGHWDVEWGAREKHGATGDRATGDHRTGDVDAAVALALARIAALSPEPEEA